MVYANKSCFVGGRCHAWAVACPCPCSVKFVNWGNRGRNVKRYALIGYHGRRWRSGQIWHFKQFSKGLSGGAEIALSYALLGAFAVAISHSGMPKALINKVVKSINSSDGDKNAKKIKWTLVFGITSDELF